jgi:hypothetical protein
VIVFIGISIMIVEYFFNIPGVKIVATEARNWTIVILAFTVVIGVLSLVQHNIQQIVKKTSTTQKFYSVWVLIIFSLFLFLGLLLPDGTKNSLYANMYNSIYVSSTSGLWSLHCFWILLAVYRAFKTKNVESSILMITSLIVLIGLAPWGGLIWSGFSPLEEWILTVPFTGGQRALYIAAAVGIVVGCIRTWLGRETGYLGRR